LATWLRCTSLGKDTTIYVNMDMVISVIQREDGARLIHGSGNASYIDVVETADDIFRAIGVEVKDAQKGERARSAPLT
jgi:hypothetical protein